MCITIATTFTVTWVPYQLNHIVLAYGNRDNRYHGVLIIDATETLTYVNSCVNPVVYALMWRPFRQSLIEVRQSCPAVLFRRRLLYAFQSSLCLSVCPAVLFCFKNRGRLNTRLSLVR